MKIYGKQVFIGTKKLCTEYTSKIIGGSSDCHIGSYEYKGTPLESNVIFIQDKYGYYVDINDIDGGGFLALHCYGAALRYKNHPNDAADIYVDELKPYLPTYDQEKLFEVKNLIYSLKNNKGITIE